MENLSGLLERLPQGFGAMLSALDRHLAPAREIAIVGRPHAEDTLALLEVVRRPYLPNTVVALRDPDGPEDAARDLPLLADRTMVEGRAAAYVCEHFACRRPVTTPAELEAELS
jgi:uncharacterized protein YyaL (SSP411 family)